jgi:hypothetical protein
MFKFLLVSMLSSSLLSAAGASGCRTKQGTNLQDQKPLPSPVERQMPGTSDLKILAEGFHSSINEPFIAVIREAGTYDALTKLEGSLPRLDAGFFDSNAVVAAFLGQRNTGGYAVEIAHEPNGQIRVTERKPGKGMMVPQMITSPFKIVSFSIGASSPIVAAGDSWKPKNQSFHVETGKFVMSGGISGRTEEYGLEGKVDVMKEGGLVTFNFILKNAGETNGHLLFEVATGIVDSEGLITIKKMSALTLVNQPNSGLQARGRFIDRGTRLTLDFESLPPVIADGYTGSGTIEATIIGSPSKP